MSWTPMVGHDRPLAEMRRAIARGRLGHAYLFVGPDGIGKRRTALHIAQGLLCEKRSPALLDPCGWCPSCTQVMARSHPDLFEISKPADKNEMPISAIAELGERLSLKSARAGYKIAIVDDADTFNQESANALLKTLEEPPPGSLLLLIATSAETQLETITSRCQLVRFDPLPKAAVANLLVTAAQIDDVRLANELASWGQGSVGTALALADPSLRAFRDALLAALSGNRFIAVNWWSLAMEQVDAAGKESSQKRSRARLIFQLAMLLLRNALVEASEIDGATATDGIDPLALRNWSHDLAGRVDAERLADAIERTLEADYQVQRFLSLPVVVECWLDDLGRLLAGHHLPAFRGR